MLILECLAVMLNHKWTRLATDKYAKVFNDQGISKEYKDCPVNRVRLSQTGKQRWSTIEGHRDNPPNTQHLVSLTRSLLHSPYYSYEALEIGPTYKKVYIFNVYNLGSLGRSVHLWKITIDTANMDYHFQIVPPNRFIIVRTLYRGSTLVRI